LSINFANNLPFWSKNHKNINRFRLSDKKTLTIKEHGKCIKYAFQKYFMQINHKNISVGGIYKK